MPRFSFGKSDGYITSRLVIRACVLATVFMTNLAWWTTGDNEWTKNWTIESGQKKKLYAVEVSDAMLLTGREREREKDMLLHV